MRRLTGTNPRRQLFGILLLGLAAACLGYSAVLAQPAPAAAENGVAVSAAAANVISLWGGARETIALKSDGTVWTWGLNDCGILGTGACSKLGDGTQLDRLVPVQVHGPGNAGYLTSITAIMGGEHANYALKSDGTVWAWGG